MIETVVKAVSLGYILGLLHLTIASWLWSFIRWKVAPGLRADTGFLIFIGTSILPFFGAAYIYYGVITFRIVMTTNIFHAAMTGWGGVSINIIGISVMLLSLFLASRGFLRARLPRGESIQIDENGGPRARLTDVVQTASAVGVIHPQIWINPEYWNGLDKRQRALVIQHENEHIIRKDNFRKLFMQFIAALYSLIPWIRTWPSTYELDSELAIDDHCRGIESETSYRELIALATSFSLDRKVEPISSGFSEEDLKYRLDVLHSERKPGSRAVSLLVAGLVVVLSTTPFLLLLSQPLTRCLLACYLGY